MLCYKDMTFCKFYTECEKGAGCFRALTPDVRARAKSIDLPISQFVDKPECFEDKPEMLKKWGLDKEPEL